LRTQLDVSKDGGHCSLLFDDASGVQLWIDGTPTPLSGNKCELQLTKGQHVINVAVTQTTRTNNFSVKLDVPAGQPHVQWSVVEQ
jgi:hypothetical protein